MGLAETAKQWHPLMTTWEPTMGERTDMSQDDATRSLYKDRIAQQVLAARAVMSPQEEDLIEAVHNLQNELNSAPEPTEDKDLQVLGMEQRAGLKADSGKCRLDLVPWGAVWSMANIREFGALKYRDWDWEKGIDYTRLIAAALRHITAYLSGEDLDPESQQSHIAHAMTGLAFLETYILQGRTDLDNRYKYKVPMKRSMPIVPKSAITKK